jgi:twitching motility protein PilT
MNVAYSIDELLAGMPGWDASDLHLTVGSSPAVRVRGEIFPVEDLEPLDAEQTQQLLYRVLSTEQQKRLEIDRQIDVSYEVPGLARFRVNVFFAKGCVGAAFRRACTS